MEEIIWINGQGELDFDYLLNLTNQKFVDGVKEDIDNSHELLAVNVQYYDWGYVKVDVVSLACAIYASVLQNNW